MSALRVSVHETIGTIEPARWDAVGTDPLSAHAVLLALEDASLHGVRLRYATVEDAAGRLVATAPMARVDTDAARLTHGPFHRFIGAVRTLHPTFMRTSVMLCGTPLSVGNPPARIAPGAGTPRLLATLAGVLDDMADADRVPWRAFKEFPATMVDAARSALGAGGPRPWLLAASEPNAAVDIEWPSYAAYLSGLRSAYRYKIRKAARRLTDAGVTVDVVPIAEAYDATLHALYEAVVDRAPVQLERLTPQFFVALGRAYGEAAPLIRFTREGNVIGWVAMLFSGEAAYDLFHGIDYAANGEVDLYFNQLAEVVRLAIERGARRLSLGQSTEVAKARFGAAPVPLWIALRHRSQALTRTMRAGARVLFPAKQVPSRHVFRHGAADAA